MKGNFFQRIHASKENLTKKQMNLAQYIVHNYKKAIFLSSSELGRKINASDATVIRFSHALGYKGFSEMINALRSEFDGTISSVSRIELLHSPAEYQTHVDFNQIRECYAQAITNEYFEDLVENLLDSSKCIILGSESTASLAEYLNYHLIRYGISSDIIKDNSESIYKIYNEADEETVVISLSVRRYTKFQYYITERLIEKNMKVYSITDSIHSPYNSLNNKCIVLNSSTEEGFNHLSHSVLMLVLQEIIRKGIVNRSKDEIAKCFSLLEKYNEDVDVFLKNKF
ncbi:transcriptional regulator, RpiR family [Alkaliphilus metalliredigens QYMF]|uniref:Transcriptional regulator, RpiR family n=1 Tax=Alkaliphilus metalliredigens (strain QYMF) TaxID=293826 RepID=A6TPC3_ALKMQ|nr:MurR/RpiR family transcriptional regulator [Alkaliphilus metalliredigens]ABR48041.1 transcriptional regulator, RpiR family [Alkaliphilus metalliredigens QYMF]